MAEQALGLAPVVANPSVLGFAGRHIGYVWNNKKNIAELKSQAEKLKAQIDDTTHSIRAAQHNAERIKTRAQLWLDGASKTSQKAGTILQEYEELEKKMCLMRCCPNPVSFYRFSRKACKIVLEVKAAITEAGQINAVSVPAVGQGTPDTLSTKGLLDFESRKSILEDIIKTLQDETMGSVGVYGLGGMGKTTLAKQVASRAAEENTFEEIVMASVTRIVDRKEIQGQIASMLGLRLGESSVAERASNIHQRLKGKKVLVILDDLWTKLDLTQVGIPSGGEHIGCKVLITSRFLPVLSSMDTEKDYVLGALKEDEAWRLFEEKVNHIVENQKFLTVGKAVAKRCAGLPILIVTVAASLAKRPHLDAWNDALTQLGEMNDQQMHDIVNSAIEFISYKYLKGGHKRLFLLCGLMQGDALFENILKYSLGWDLFAEDQIVTVEGARNRLLALIFDLKESCLLLDGDASDDIKMHDVVRDVAISIARKDLNAFSAGDNDTDLSRWPNNDVLNKCTGMVFKNCTKLPCFPQRLECPSLQLFIILSEHWGLSKSTIPDSFFERTGKLKLLDMTALCFPTLPSSLSFLKNLQSLHLDHCELEDISIVGELKKLQVLSLIGSTIQELPSSLGQLSELKLLDLTQCSQLKVIPAGLIASLSQLEELHMRQSFDGWESEECLNSSGTSNASFAELKCLHNLSSLKVQLQDTKLLAEDINIENLKRYEIFTRDRWDWLFEDRVEIQGINTIIALQLDANSINHLQNVVDTLFKKTEYLCLEKLRGYNVIPELNEDRFPELKHLHITEGDEIQYIVSVEGEQHKASFPALESLQLYGLDKIMKICNAKLMEGSFYNLTTMEVHGCESLKSLFSSSTITPFPYLQKIEVSECELLKQIVAREEGETKTETLIFPRLSIITLAYLPNFTTFYSGLVEETTTSETVTQPLFDEKVRFPSLKTLSIKHLDGIRAIWPNKVGTNQSNLKDKPQEIPIFQNLTEVTVKGCESLKFVFPASVARSLDQLMKVCVEDCGVETIISKDEDMELEKLEAGTTTFTLPKLVTITLTKLPKMECFCPREYTIECPVLKVLDYDEIFVLDFFRSLGKQGDDGIIKVISSLKRLGVRSEELSTLLGLCDHFPPRLSLEELTISDFHSELSALPSKFVSRIHNQLQKFELSNCSFQEIFSYEGDATDQYILGRLEDLSVTECPRLTNLVPPSVSFKSLSYLKISNCGGLITLLQPSTARSLWTLKILDISGCEMIEEIIGGEVRDDDEASSSSCREDEIVFNLFWRLILKKLPRLTNFCSSRNYTFNFPNLEEVRVIECPSMKTFCGGIKTTPKLNQVHLNMNWRERRWEGELNKTIHKIYEEREAQRLATALPSILATKHSEAQAQEERVAGTCDKSKGKEVVVYEQGVEHFDKSKASRYSDPSCSNYTASSSQLSPQISNHPNEIDHLATQVEAHTLAATVLTSSSIYQFQAQPQVHHTSPEKSIVEPKNESIVLRNHTDDIGKKESDICENVIAGPLVTRPVRRFVRGRRPGKSRIGTAGELSPQISNHPHQVNHLPTQVAIPSFRGLILRGTDMPRLLGLEELIISEFQGELSPFPSKFLNMIHRHLQTFKVSNCSFQEIFPYEGDVTNHVNDDDVLFPKLRILVLEKLSELKYICKQDQHSSIILNILNRLEYLRVRECPRLTNLVPPSVSFKLLKGLSLVNCGGLINLLQPSTTRSLEQLEFLYISGCEMVEEVIGGEVRDDEESSSSCHEDEIFFNKLWYLRLKELPRLTNFCSSRNYTFNFPKLGEVHVIKCPNIKTFCGGIVTTPELNKVHFMNFVSEEHWEGELNTTIEKMYEQKEAERLATTLPSVIATNHFGAQAQEQRVAKEVKLLEKPETPRYSEAFSSNYTASSSQLSPQINNHLASQVEAHTLAATVLTSSSIYQFQAQPQVHHMEQKKESPVLRNQTDDIGKKKSDICENVIAGPLVTRPVRRIARRRGKSRIGTAGDGRFGDFRINFHNSTELEQIEDQSLGPLVVEQNL